MLAYPEHDSVSEIAACRLVVGVGNWPFAGAKRDEIDAHWEQAVRANPTYFNGTIYLMETFDLADGALSAHLIATEFKNYLYWRHCGFPSTGVRDGFGSALISSSDGAYVLARQRPGNVNAGLTYLPGGFIDARDVGTAGDVDMAKSIAREVAEETGLSGGILQPRPGFLVTQKGAHVSIAKVFDASLDADAVKARIDDHIAGEANSELEEAVVVRAYGDLRDLAMPGFARVLLSELLTKGSGRV